MPVARKLWLQLGFDAGRCSTPADHRDKHSPGAAPCGSACRCRGRSCGTAALWDHRADRRRRDKRLGILRGCDGTASRAVCRPSRAAAPRVGGSACRHPRPPCRARHQSVQRNRPSGRSARGRAGRRHSRCRYCRAARASPGSSTGICPDVTTCLGPAHRVRRVDRHDLAVDQPI